MLGAGKACRWVAGDRGVFGVVTVLCVVVIRVPSRGPGATSVLFFSLTPKPGRAPGTY